MRVSEIRVKRIRVNQGLGVSIIFQTYCFLSLFGREYQVKVLEEVI